MNEFYDKTRKKICLLDDNFFACPKWKEIIETVKDLNKPFQFKQGLDERLLTEKHIDEIVVWKYDGDFIFAFDDYNDRDLIIKKLNMIFKTHPNFKKYMRFYLFCAYDRDNIYDEKFWINDICHLFDRSFILAKYSAFSYVMRHENYNNSLYRGIYINFASWANQPSLFKTMSFYEFCCRKGMSAQDYKLYKNKINEWIASDCNKGASYKYMKDFIDKHKDIADKYFYTTPKDLAEYGCWIKK